MGCKQCGQCCTYIMAPLPGVTRTRDPQDVVKYFEHHGIRVYEGDNSLMLRIPLNCRFVEFDTASGKTFCLLYGQFTRPKICQEYLCDRAREGD